MTSLREKRFKYVFPSGWRVEKWDDTEFHTDRFSNSLGSAKSVDFIAISPDPRDEIWLIECKDFRLAAAKSIKEKCDGIPQKFKDSLAALVCARNDCEGKIQSFSRSALKKTQLRCIVHWEFAFPHDRRLFPPKTMVANIKNKLKQQLRVADPSSLIGNQQHISAVLPLTIQEIL